MMKERGGDRGQVNFSPRAGRMTMVRLPLNGAERVGIMSQPENAGKKVNLRGVIDDAVFLVIFYICMKVLFNFFLTARGFPIEFVLTVISAVIGLAAAFLCARSGVRHNVMVLLALYAVLLCVGCCVDYLAIHSEESGILRYLPQLLSVLFMLPGVIVLGAARIWMALRTWMAVRRT